MRENLISVFERGNQEMFHSAFLAWLLRPSAPHGLGDSFLRSLMARLPHSYWSSIPETYEVKTEAKKGDSRFDIVLDANGAGKRKGIVFENKIKSFGKHLQPDTYSACGYDVAMLALLPETLDSETRARYPVVDYNTLLQILQSLPLKSTNHYHFVISQYADFLRDTLAPFNLLRGVACGDLQPSVFLRQLAKAVRDCEFSDNDVRTFSHFYHHNLAEYLRTKAPDLWFGDSEYAVAEKQTLNTRWICEKNMQGPPFMECILFDPCHIERWEMHRKLRNLYPSDSFSIMPRLELWLNPTLLAQAQDVQLEVGKIMLGTWSDELKRTLRETEPYRSRLNRAGRRNFHHEPVHVHELPFERLAERIRAMLMTICDKKTRRAVGAA